MRSSERSSPIPGSWSPWPPSRHPIPLAELVARPALNLHVPELAILTSPLTRTWAARRELLERVSLPHGDTLDLAVLLAAWQRGGLRAITELPVAAPLRPERDGRAAGRLRAAVPAGRARGRHARPLERVRRPRRHAAGEPRRASCARVSRLLLIRHGQSTWNAAHRWQGQADPPLSAAGEAQARAAVAGFARLPPFAALLCSPLQRARRTAQVLADGAGLAPPVPVPGLEERDAGPWQGLTHAEIDAEYPGARHGTWRPPGYEPDEQLRARVLAALLPHAGASVAVVVHEGVIRALDGEPAALANLDARWLAPAGGSLRADGARFSLIGEQARTKERPGRAGRPGLCEDSAGGAPRGGTGDYMVLIVIFATPMTRPALSASMPKVWFSRSAASCLSLTVVPSSTALEPSAFARSGFSVRPSRKNSGALGRSLFAVDETSPVRTDLPGSMSKFGQLDLLAAGLEASSPQPRGRDALDERGDRARGVVRDVAAGDREGRDAGLGDGGGPTGPGVTLRSVSAWTKPASRVTLVVKPVTLSTLAAGSGLAESLEAAGAAALLVLGCRRRRRRP